MLCVSFFKKTANQLFFASPLLTEPPINYFLRLLY